VRSVAVAHSCRLCTRCASSMSDRASVAARGARWTTCWPTWARAEQTATRRGGLAGRQAWPQRRTLRGSSRGSRLFIGVLVSAAPYLDLPSRALTVLQRAALPRICVHRNDSHGSERADRLWRLGPDGLIMLPRRLLWTHPDGLFGTRRVV
jgi:hypothetical protein